MTDDRWAESGATGSNSTLRTLHIDHRPSIIGRLSGIRDDRGLAEANLVDAAPLRLEHLGEQAVALEGLADGGHAPDARQDVAAHGLEPLRFDREAEAIAELVEADLGAEHVRAVALVHDRLALDVILVADLADDLLQQIFDRDEARRAAVLVHDDGHLDLPALELLQQLGNALGLG